MDSLGERLKDLRGLRTQNEVAKALGMAQQLYRTYENDEHLPGTKLILKICKYYDVSADWLLGIEKKQTGEVVVNGSGNAVATGAHSVAIAGSSSAPGRFAACSKCPYRAAVTKLQKAGLKVPGLDG